MSEEKDVKPGVKSSEFLLTILGVVGMVAGMLFGKLDAGTATLVIGILVGLYTVARAIVKVTPTTKDDELLDAIKDKILDKLPLPK